MANEKYKTYLQPAFLICVIVLAIAGSGMKVAIERFGVYLKKTPLPLKKTLDLLEESDLSPYKIVHKQLIENADILEGLGIEDYIQWTLEDSSENAEKTTRHCKLFITYYRLPDRVPHVPEECYAGGGFQRLATEKVTFQINTADFHKEIHGKYLVFGRKQANSWNRSEKFPVLYLFKVNGIYAASRDEARIALNKNIFGKSSYFCKVEVIFNHGSAAPSKEQAVAASEKILGVILPLLEKKHWPDWKSGAEQIN